MVVAFQFSNDDHHSQNYKYFLVDEPNPNHKCRSEITMKGKEKKKEKIMKVIMMKPHDVFTH